MKKLYLTAALGLCFVGGCHTPKVASDVPVPAADVPSVRAALRRLPPVAQVAELQLVAFQQDDAASPSDAPEPLPEPSRTEALASNLTLADLENLALQNSPVLCEKAARVEAAQGNWQQVGLAPNPVVGYSGQQLGSGGEAEQNGVYIGQEFVTGHKLKLNREQAAWEVRQAQTEYDAYQLRVLTDVRISYYEVLIAQQRRDLAGDLVRVSEQGAAAADALFRGEEVSEADPLRASVEADMARIELQTSINQHAESWRRLTAVLGMPELAEQRLMGELDPNGLELSWQENLHRVLSESPEIAAALAEVQAARWGIQRAYAEVVPNIDVQAIVQDDRSTGSTNGNLQVTLPIPLWNRNQGGIRKAYWEAAAAQQAVDRLALDLQSRLASAFQRYESARNQVEKYSRKDGVLEKSERTLELIRTGYQADEFGVLELLSAQRTYFQTNLAYLDAQRELWVAAMEIQGLLLRDSLEK